MRKRVFTFLLCLLSLSVLAAKVDVPRLSPMPERVMSERVPLAGKWLFNPAPDEGFWKQTSVAGWKDIEVPGEWVMQGFEVEKGRKAGYFRTFAIPSSWHGQRVKLRCNGVYSDATIYVNGREAGSHLGGFTAFELDVTGLVRCGADNSIAVAVASESAADATSSASRYAVHPLGGITRDIFLFALPQTNLSMLHASTTFDSTYTDAVLKAEVEVANDGTAAAAGCRLVFELNDANGNAVGLDSAEREVGAVAPGEKKSLAFDFCVKNPAKWDPEHPNLYRLTCRLMQGGTTVETSVRRIGFRQIEVRGNQVFVNNRPIKLRGICHHEVMPLRGRSVSDNMWRKDVELFREGNVNYFRTSHYPPDEALLEACDELGMFVEVEAPFCWAHESKVPDSVRKEILVDQHLAMVNLDRTHPSVLMWSIGNESNLYNEYFKEAARLVKEVDPTRPRNFSQWGPEGDGGDLEITNHHYPGPEGPDKYRDYGRPVVFDEFCHLNAYNRLEQAADPGLRSVWGMLLDRMWNGMYHSKGVLGGALWAGIDDTFFLPGGRAVGYGTWGPVDGWRRPKPEYWGMKKAFSPVKIALEGNQEHDGTVRFSVENRYLFSNLSETRIEWKAGECGGVLSPDVPAGGKGEFCIVVPADARQAGAVDIKVMGVRGFEVDAYHFQTVPADVQPAKAPSARRVNMKTTADAYEITTAGGTFRIDRLNGMLSAVKNGTPIVVKGAELMVLPLNGEGEGIQMVGKNQKFEPYTPVCARWTATAVSAAKESGGVSVRVKGVYDEAEGQFDYFFSNTGELRVAYHFTMLKDVSPRQVGVVFSLPDEFDCIAWKRKGYWSVYPKDHIGALEGEAVAFDPSLPISGLAGPSAQPAKAWAYDQTAAGSNMFRSTKENIYEATLSAGKAHSVKVVSDGTQHIRAWKHAKGISFVVADYSNGGCERFLTPHSGRDFRPLKRGDKISGTVKLWLK